MSNKIKLAEVENGKIFKIGDVEFIKFSNENGKVEVVTKYIIFNSTFGNDNDFAKSDILKRLNDEFLPKVAAIVGEENICEFKTDLTTLDGLKPYAPLLSKISLPTLDFYRKNVEIFDKYNPDSWWWLATPESAKPHSRPSWTVCVSPRGDIGYDGYYSGSGGVRPILNFVSSIFVSCEE